MRNIVIVTLILAMFGCNNSTTDSAASSQPQVEQSVVAQPTANNVLKGKLVIGHEVSSFAPCGDSLSYWINDESDELEKRYSEITKNSKSPYSEVYCEVIAEKVAKSEEDGFAADYDGILEVKKVVKVEMLSAENTCK